MVNIHCNVSQRFLRLGVANDAGNDLRRFGRVIERSAEVVASTKPRIVVRDGDGFHLACDGDKPGFGHGLAIERERDFAVVSQSGNLETTVRTGDGRGDCRERVGAEYLAAGELRKQTDPLVVIGTHGLQVCVAVTTGIEADLSKPFVDRCGRRIKNFDDADAHIRYRAALKAEDSTFDRGRIGGEPQSQRLVRSLGSDTLPVQAVPISNCHHLQIPVDELRTLQNAQRLTGERDGEAAVHRRFRFGSTGPLEETQFAAHDDCPDSVNCRTGDWFAIGVEHTAADDHSGGIVWLIRLRAHFGIG